MHFKTLVAIIPQKPQLDFHLFFKQKQKLSTVPVSSLLTTQPLDQPISFKPLQ